MFRPAIHKIYVTKFETVLPELQPLLCSQLFQTSPSLTFHGLWHGDSYGGDNYGVPIGSKVFLASKLKIHFWPYRYTKDNCALIYCTPSNRSVWSTWQQQNNKNTSTSSHKLILQSNSSSHNLTSATYLIPHKTSSHHLPNLTICLISLSSSS